MSDGYLKVTITRDGCGSPALTLHRWRARDSVPVQLHLLELVMAGWYRVPTEFQESVASLLWLLDWQLGPVGSIVFPEPSCSLRAPFQLVIGSQNLFVTEQTWDLLRVFMSFNSYEPS